MGCPELDYANWAYLNEKGIPVLCARQEANHWFRSGGGQRSQVRLDRIRGWNIGTRFCTFSVSPDGPPLFWQVCLWDENHLFRVGEQRFASKEAALEFHASLIGLFHTGADRASELFEIAYYEDYEDGGEEDPADWWKEQRP